MNTCFLLKGATGGNQNINVQQSLLNVHLHHEQGNLRMLCKPLNFRVYTMLVHANEACAFYSQGEEPQHRSTEQ